MKKEQPTRRNTVAFFGILYALSLFIIWRKTAWIDALTPMKGALIIIGLFAVLSVAPALTPVFRVVLSLTRRLGTMIFAILSLLVFFLILSPLALIMRMGGKRFLPDHREIEGTWYEKWSSGESPDKQY